MIKEEREKIFFMMLVTLANGTCQRRLRKHLDGNKHFVCGREQSIVQSRRVRLESVLEIALVHLKDQSGEFASSPGLKRTLKNLNSTEEELRKEIGGKLEQEDRSKSN